MRDETPLRVLIVEDDIDSADMLAEALAALGYDSRYVLGGPAALAALDESWPDVVVLDVGLPEMDGYVLASRIRQTHLDKRIRIIALSGYRPDRERASVFDAYLLKPVDLDLLQQAFETERRSP